MSYKCFLDMDGVIADFMGSLCAAHGKTSPYVDSKNLGTFDTEKIWGISDREFWAPVAKNSYDFWKGIEKTHDADGIVAAVEEAFGRENVCILTAPSKDPGSVPGKREWIARNYPQFNKRMIFATASTKQFMAGIDKVLVDDKDTNVDEFRKSGGAAVLVPRQWNEDYLLSVNTLKHVQNRLTIWKGRN